MLRFSGSVLRENSGFLTGLIARAVRMQDKVIVGVPDDDTHDESGESLAMIAAVHEYGSITRKIPARPFLHPALRKSQNKYSKVLAQKATAILLGRFSLNQALALVGEMAQADVQKYIVDHQGFDPLKPATIKRKKSSKPLIDTGQMRQSIRYKIER